MYVLYQAGESTSTVHLLVIITSTVLSSSSVRRRPNVGTTNAALPCLLCWLDPLDDVFTPLLLLLLLLLLPLLCLEYSYTSSTTINFPA